MKCRLEKRLGIERKLNITTHPERLWKLPLSGASITDKLVTSLSKEYITHAKKRCSSRHSGISQSCLCLTTKTFIVMLDDGPFDTHSCQSKQSLDLTIQVYHTLLACTGKAVSSRVKKVYDLILSDCTRWKAHCMPKSFSGTSSASLSDIFLRKLLLRMHHRYLQSIAIPVHVELFPQGQACLYHLR